MVEPLGLGVVWGRGLYHRLQVQVNVLEPREMHSRKSYKFRRSAGPGYGSDLIAWCRWRLNFLDHVMQGNPKVWQSCDTNLYMHVYITAAHQISVFALPRWVLDGVPFVPSSSLSLSAWPKYSLVLHPRSTWQLDFALHPYHWLSSTPT